MTDASACVSENLRWLTWTLGHSEPTHHIPVGAWCNTDSFVSENPIRVQEEGIIECAHQSQTLEKMGENRWKFLSGICNYLCIHLKCVCYIYFFIYVFLSHVNTAKLG